MIPHVAAGALLRPLRRILAMLVLLLTVLIAMGAVVVVQAGRDEATSADTAVLMLDGGPAGQAARLDRAVRLYLGGQISRIVLAGGDTASARGVLVGRGVVGDKIFEVREGTELAQLTAVQKLLQASRVPGAILIVEPVEALRLLKIARDYGLSLHSAPTGADTTIDLVNVAREVGRYLVYCFAGR